MTNAFALNHDKSLPAFFFCVKCQAKNDFLKDVELGYYDELRAYIHIPITGIFTDNITGTLRLSVDRF